MDILQTAESLGLELPTYTKADRPDLFQCWSDRVELFSRLHDAGRDTIALRRDTNAYAGHVLSSSPFDPFGIETPAWLDAAGEAAIVENADSDQLLGEIEAVIRGQSPHSSN